MDELALPHDLDAERSVLGACLLRAAAVHEVRDALRPEEFYRQAHQHVYAAILHVAERGIDPDYRTVIDRLKQQDLLEDCGGVSYVTALTDGVPMATHVRHYAAIVRRHAILREAVQFGRDVTAAALAPDAEPEVLLEDIEARTLRLSTRQASTQGLETAESLVGDFLDHLQALREGRIRAGVATGLTDLDGLTGGLPRGLVILGARPSHGKTALTMNIALHVAQQVGPVAYFSLEQDRVQARARWLAMLSGVDGARIERGRLSEADLRRVMRALRVFEALPLHLHAQPAGVPFVRAQSRRLKAQHPDLALVVVDYVQLLDFPPRPRSVTREQELAAASRALKRLGVELELPVVACAQLSREVERRKSPEPTLADLRESGALEQDGDLVLLLHRPCLFDPEAEPTAAVLQVAKQRQGPIGRVELRYQASCLRFTDDGADRSETGPTRQALFGEGA